MEQWIAIYVRVSTDKQAEEGYSIEAQIESCTVRAKVEYGEEIGIQIYKDEGISGQSIKKRPSMLRLIKDVKAGRIKAVMTWKVSRLARKLVDGLNLVELFTECGSDFISLKEGKFDSVTGKLTFRLLSTLSEYFREELAENVQLGMTQRAKLGLWNGGVVLGYRSINGELAVVPEEAEVVKLIFQKYVHEKWGTSKITRHLNFCGYKTKKGNAFAVSAVYDILKNPIYKGYIRFNQVKDWNSKRRKGTNHDVLIVKGIHKPIVSEDEWDEANGILHHRKTDRIRHYSGTFPLTGILKCPECETYMTSMYGAKLKSGQKARYYVCGLYHNSGKALCASNLVRAEVIEEAVWRTLDEQLKVDNVFRNIIVALLHNHLPENGPEVEDLQRYEEEMSKLYSAKLKIQTAYETGLYTLEETSERMDYVRREMTYVTQIIQSLQTQVKKEPEFETFEDLRTLLEPMQFRDLLRNVVGKIHVESKQLKEIVYGEAIPSSM